MASGDTKTEALLNVLGNGGSTEGISGCANTKTQNYILDAINRIQGVEGEVEELKNNPDVVDIVDTYANLQAYDTQHLTENDIIRVLQDETHSGNSTYYRFTKNPDTWTFIGEISGGGGPTVVQTTGTSTTDVMSQDATTKMVLRGNTSVNIRSDGSFSAYSISIGNNSSAGDSAAIAIGGGSSLGGAKAIGIYSIAIGSSSKARGKDSVAIGYGAFTQEESTSLGHQAGMGSTLNVSAINNVYLGHDAGSISHTNHDSVALGHSAQFTRTGEVNVGAGSTTNGYNGTSYRVIGGVHDGQLAQDAVTVNQVNSVIDAINTALSTNIPHIGAQS